MSFPVTFPPFWPHAEECASRRNLWFCDCGVAHSWVRDQWRKECEEKGIDWKAIEARAST